MIKVIVNSKYTSNVVLTSLFTFLLIVLFFWLPSSEKNKVVITGIISVLSSMLLLIKQHKEKVELQHDQQRFDLSVSTHAANVIFDRLVLFCEEYVYKVHEIIKTSASEGPSKIFLSLGWELSEIRNKHFLCIPYDLSILLENFEADIRKIGAGAKFTELYPDRAFDSGYTEEMFKIHQNILGITAEKPDIMISNVINSVRKILKIEELFSLRQNLITKYYINKK